MLAGNSAEQRAINTSRIQKAKSSEQLRITEDLLELKTTAVLLVDAQGHGLISAKIASQRRSIFVYRCRSTAL